MSKKFFIYLIAESFLSPWNDLKCCTGSWLGPFQKRNETLLSFWTLFIEIMSYCFDVNLELAQCYWGWLSIACLPPFLNIFWGYSCLFWGCIFWKSVSWDVASLNKAWRDPKQEERFLLSDCVSITFYESFSFLTSEPIPSSFTGVELRKGFGTQSFLS